MECVFTSPVRTEYVVCDVLYVCVCCFVACGCGVSKRYIDVCYCDMFSVVNVYLDHLKLCVVCINGRRYVCCGECYVISNECNEPTSCLLLLFAFRDLWKEWGDSNFQISSQNCQFHHRRLE